MESKSLCLRDDFRFFTPLCYVQNDRMSTLPSISLGLLCKPEDCQYGEYRVKPVSPAAPCWNGPRSPTYTSLPRSRPWPMRPTSPMSPGWTTRGLRGPANRPLGSHLRSLAHIAANPRPRRPALTGYGVPQRPQRPQHKPQLEQPDLSHPTALTPQYQPGSPLLRGNQHHLVSTRSDLWIAVPTAAHISPA